MGILDRLFGRDEPDAVKALERPTWWSNVWNTEGEDGKDEYGDSPSGRIGAVQSNVWAYNCVKARMAAVAQAPMKLYRGSGEDREEITEHPVLDLLSKVNPLNLNALSFRRGIEQQLSLHGRCLIQKVRGTGGVVELYILPMNYVEIVPDARMWIAGFRWLPTNDFVPRADVIDISYPALDGSVEADSPTAVALDAINRYNLADKAQASIDRRGGQKGGMVIHPPGTIAADFDRIRMAWDRWRKNPDNAGRDMHVSNGFEYTADAFSAVEMQREERLMRIANEIMAPYGVPPAIAGDYKDASKLANAEAQRKNFWESFAVDELKLIEEELTFALLHAEYPGADDLYFQHDLSNIAALREDADSRVNRAIALSAANLASVNEARNLVGLDMSDDPAADRILMEASQADVVADPAPLIGIIDQRNKGIITDDAAATLLRIAAPNLTDEQVVALLTREAEPAPATAPEPVAPPPPQEEPPVPIPSVEQEDSTVDDEEDALEQQQPMKAVDETANDPWEPPAVVRKAAERGLELRREFGRGGTEIGVARARDLSNGKRIPPQTINRMLSYFARHEVDKKGEGWGDENNPSAGYIAWLLWGGDAGWSWARGIEREYPAEVKAFPYVDPVGLVAETIDGEELGIIDALHRGGVHDGVKASVKSPVFTIAGKAYASGEVMVRHA